MKIMKFDVNFEKNMFKGFKESYESFSKGYPLRQSLGMSFPIAPYNLIFCDQKTIYFFSTKLVLNRKGKRRNEKKLD